MTKGSNETGNEKNRLHARSKRNAVPDMDDALPEVTWMRGDTKVASGAQRHNYGPSRALQSKKWSMEPKTEHASLAGFHNFQARDLDTSLSKTYLKQALRLGQNKYLDSLILMGSWWAPHGRGKGIQNTLRYTAMVEVPASIRSTVSIPKSLPVLLTQHRGYCEMSMLAYSIATHLHEMVASNSRTLLGHFFGSKEIKSPVIGSKSFIFSFIRFELKGCDSHTLFWNQLPFSPTPG
ncbi:MULTISPECIES: hypothetical protein [Acidithrix]|uniref:Uncharacterized protein n=1 Tax=Acidithrix ferrooxidans TaxID=1280514 RepID=A0A0D8HDQ7_9ACTN|nr:MULTISPECIES: hypothetical protein [Acidithrix]KJF16095.1 hypothetical protein AXFE_30410 [Acidithrix ferrooxidans]CAG4905120.1 unnamed protein product [Acidithrix sp. C25]